MKKHMSVAALFFASLLLAVNAFADTVKVGDIDWSSEGVLGGEYVGDNGFKAVQLNGIYALDETNLTTYNNLIYDRIYDATSRAGVFWPQENDNPLPSTNIGQEEDGLLNGENKDRNKDSYSYLNNTQIDNVYDTMEYQFDGLEFISDGDLQDVDGIDANKDGRFDDDPGWIHLYKEDVDEEITEYGSIKGSDGSEALDISTVLTFDIDYYDDGEYWNWTLTPDGDIIDKVSPILGENIFDHLALSIKGGNGFAVYDFDFNMIFDLESDKGNDFSFQPYILTGTFTTEELLKGSGDPGPGLSHIAVWARDPAEDFTVIPEPSTLILFGAGLAGLSFYTRRRRK